MKNIVTRLRMKPQHGFKRRRYPNFETWCRFRAHKGSKNTYSVLLNKISSHSLGRALWMLDKNTLIKGRYLRNDSTI